MTRRQINLRLTDAELLAIDEARGPVPREAWLRELIAEQVDLPTASGHRASCKCLNCERARGHVT